MARKLNAYFVKLMAVCLALASVAGESPSKSGPGVPPNRVKRQAVKRQAAKREAVIAELEKAIPELMREGDVTGLSIAVVRDGRLLWTRGFGLMNAETKEPVSDTTVFEAASLSKPLVAYAALKLVDQGKLDLDAPLSGYLPEPYVENDDRLKLITARRVLSHTTGFPNWRPNERGPLKILVTPGEKFSYSGEGFVYLQRVIEHMEGQPLDAVMKRMVFDPLGMTGSSYVWQERYEKLAAFRHDAAHHVKGRNKVSEANAAASLKTTASDYAKFVIAIMDGAGLKRETAALMLTPQVRVDEACTNCTGRPLGKLSSSVSWGLGWGLQQTAERTAFWHWGDNGDTKAYVVAYPKQKLAVMIFANNPNGLSNVPELLRRTVGGAQPAFAWLHYETYDSPARKLFKDIVARGEAAIAEYVKAKRKEPARALGEDQMNRLGYQLLYQARKVKEAIEVFKINVEDHPGSFNAYDSLGEAYAVSGDKDLAIKSYRKSVELNPNSESGIEALKKLEQGGAR
ncbi:MAG TPA: serine hydrolase [Blastocatellia bacterium]|nr:serine hydrolase [Blastocatellia bacterium]